MDQIKANNSQDLANMPMSSHMPALYSHPVTRGWRNKMFRWNINRKVALSINAIILTMKSGQTSCQDNWLKMGSKTSSQMTPRPSWRSGPISHSLLVHHSAFCLRAPACLSAVLLLSASPSGPSSRHSLSPSQRGRSYLLRRDCSAPCMPTLPDPQPQAIRSYQLLTCESRCWENWGILISSSWKGLP